MAEDKAYLQQEAPLLYIITSPISGDCKEQSRN